MVTVQHPRDLLAHRLVIQPYGFWHQPAVRIGAMALGLACGVIVAFWLGFSSPGESRAEAEADRVAQEALKRSAETTAQELALERASRADLERQVETLGREVQRLRDELAATQQKAAKKRKRAEDDEAARMDAPQGSTATPAASDKLARGAAN